MAAPPTLGAEMMTAGPKEPCSLTITPVSTHFKGPVVPMQSPSIIEQDTTDSAGTVFRNDHKGDGDFSDVSRTSSSISSVSSLSSVSSATLSTSSSFSAKSADDTKVEEETFPAVVWDLSAKSFEMTEEVWLHCEVSDTGIGIPGKS